MDPHGLEERIVLADRRPDLQPTATKQLDDALAQEEVVLGYDDGEHHGPIVPNRERGWRVTIAETRKPGSVIAP